MAQRSVRRQHVPGVQSEMNRKPGGSEESCRGTGQLTDKVTVTKGADSGDRRVVTLADALSARTAVTGGNRVL